MDKFKSYDQYKKFILKRLPDAAGKWWEDGVWKRTGKDISHILPVTEGNSPTVNRNNRVAAIKEYLGFFDCKKCLGEELKGLHQFTHHLNSSQLLCMMFFSKLIDNECCATEKLVTFIMKVFGIIIHKGAICKFEFIQNDVSDYQFDVKDGELQKGIEFYEGTSFDFHIQDGETEVFFEIKFTERGFNKEKRDGRHEVKARQYLEIAPQFVREILTSEDGFLIQYQIYRNIIRATDSNKYVIFISDGNNPATNKDKNIMEKLMHPNVQFKTWQDICKEYPDELPFQFKVLLGNY